MPDEKWNSRDKSRLEGMNEKLYSRTRYRAPEDLREPISPKDGPVLQEDWGTTPLDELLKIEREMQEHHPVLKKIFIAALLFFICASAAALLIYFNGNNFISTRNLDIVVNAPVTIAAGQAVDLEISILNKNNAALRAVNLTISYPDGSRRVENGTTPLGDERESIESIAPGGRLTRNQQAVFLGSAGEVKTVSISVTYKVEGSNATFTKEKPFDLTIGSAPVIVSVMRPETVTSGETFEAVISVLSNSEETLRGVTLRAEYPYGWKLTSSVPQVSIAGQNRWNLGDLSPGDKKTITLRGTLLGEDNEERTFRFFAASGAGSEESLLSADAMQVVIKKPALDLSVRLNGESNVEYIAPAGGAIQARITMKNNLPENLLSPQVEVKLSGPALNKLSIFPQGGGSYNSAQSSITWNNSNSSEMQTMAPGDTRVLVFNFASLDNIPPGTGNQKVDLSISLTGRPQNEASNVVVSELRTVKIASEVSLSSRTLYSRGPFENRGPIPPKAESETAYTTVFTLGNTQNNVIDGKVTATLGANVTWIQESSPADEVVTYDDNTRTITWHVGELPSGSGFSSPGRELFLHLLIKPSLGQVGGVPVLLSNIAFIGLDTFTETDLRVANQALTTRMDSDPNYVQGDEIVVK